MAERTEGYFKEFIECVKIFLKVKSLKYVLFQRNHSKSTFSDIRQFTQQHLLDLRETLRTNFWSLSRDGGAVQHLYF